MKRLLAGIVLCAAAYGVVVAGDTVTQRALSSAKMVQIEQNLINAFESGIPGLQTSAAITMIQVQKEVPGYRWSNSIIPLMRVVNGEDNDANARTMAALALSQLRSDCGDYSIVRNARFTSNPRVRRYCTLLAANRLAEKEAP
jgi:hypothetical protein